MKKIFSILMIGILCFSLVGCQNNIKKDTKEGKKEEEKKEKKTDIINDNASYFLKIDGKKFVAGDKVSKLSEVEYQVRKEEENVEIPANKYMIGAGRIVNKENKHIFDITPFNTTSSAIKVPDSVIGGVNINYVWAKNDERTTNFEVYGGIKLNSTEEEVKKVFGEPSSSTNTDSSKTYRYESDEVYRNYKFTFNQEGKVTSMSWQNLVFNRKK